jgi:chorismate synthase
LAFIVVQAREASRSLLPPLPQNLGIKTPTALDGREKNVDPTKVPKAEQDKLVIDSEGRKIAGGSEGKVFGDE